MALTCVSAECRQACRHGTPSRWRSRRFAGRARTLVDARGRDVRSGGASRRLTSGSLPMHLRTRRWSSVDAGGRSSLVLGFVSHMVCRSLSVARLSSSTRHAADGPPQASPTACSVREAALTAEPQRDTGEVVRREVWSAGVSSTSGDLVLTRSDSSGSRRDARRRVRSLFTSSLRLRTRTHEVATRAGRLSCTGTSTTQVT